MGRKRVLTDDERKARKREYDKRYYATHRDALCKTAADWYASNAERKKETTYKWRKTNSTRYREITRTGHLRRTYNITLEDYNIMLEAQGHRCAICGGVEPGGRTGRFNVDHDHDTGYVRGLLCTSCNIGIGHLKENPSILQSAIDYLTP